MQPSKRVQIGSRSAKGAFSVGRWSPAESLSGSSRRLQSASIRGAIRGLPLSTRGCPDLSITQEARPGNYGGDISRWLVQSERLARQRTQRRAFGPSRRGQAAASAGLPDRSPRVTRHERVNRRPRPPKKITSGLLGWMAKRICVEIPFLPIRGLPRYELCAIFSNYPIKGPARSPGRKESGRRSTQTSWPSDFACGVQGFAAPIGKFGK